MGCVLIYSAQEILGTMYPGSHRTKYTYHKGDCYRASESQEEKASFKPLECHSGVMLTLGCLTQLKIVPLNTTRVTALNTAELGYSKAGLLKNCQQCHAKKLWGDGTLFAAWKFRSASQSLGPQMSSPKSCNIVMYWHGDI